MRPYRSMGMVLAAAAAMAVGVGFGRDTDEARESASAKSPRLRRPVAAVLLDDGKTLVTANRRSGSLSVVDTEAGRVAREIRAGKRLSDLAALPDESHLLALDQGAHELIVLRPDGNTWTVHARRPVPRFPVSIAVTDDGAQCVIASLWSRRVTVVDVSSLGATASSARLPVVHSVKLPFPPREQLLLPGRSKVVTADAFGGRLAVIDVAAGTVDAVRELPVHNIRGLGRDDAGERVFISHQSLGSSVPTTLDNIHWGVLVSNAVRSIRVDKLLDPQADLRDESGYIELGTVGGGAGDPAGLAVRAEGRLVVALAGVGKVALTGPGGTGMTQLRVGRRPTAVRIDRSAQRACVLNTLSDSVSVVDLRRGKILREISLGPMPDGDAMSPRDRGQLLFYDARLSHDNWLSCHSCHTDGHTSGGSADTLGDGSYGAPKRIPPLGGVADTGRWGWTGKFKQLNQQVHSSVRTTLQGEDISGRQVNDLVAFLHALEPAPPVLAEADLRQSPRLRRSVDRGRTVFERHGCIRCHVPPLTYTTNDTYDVGLTDAAGNEKFNPPSLRGVSRRASYFHDGRAETLRAVFTDHGHQIGTGLSERELADLLNFLRSL